MSTVHEAAATVNYDSALLAGAARATAAYPGEQATIEKALQICLADGVVLLAGGVAHVQSQTDPLHWYETNGTCQCRAFAHAPGGRCKHRFARALHRAALARAEQQAQAPEQRFYATYYPPSGEAQSGIATWQEARQCWLFVAEDGSEPVYPALQALALGGRCDLADDQRQVDGAYWERMASPAYIEWRAGK